MSIFGTIMDKIFHHPSASPADASPAAMPAASPDAAPTPTEANASAPAAASSAQQPVDVGAVLTQMASTKGGGGNYQTSIVDLLKLLDLESSLDAPQATCAGTERPLPARTAVPRKTSRSTRR